jgi:hypothetical protein
VRSKQLSGRGFIDKTIRRAGRKRLVLRCYYDRGQVVHEKIFMAEPCAQGGEPDWVLTRGAQVSTSRPRRESWELGR